MRRVAFIPKGRLSVLLLVLWCGWGLADAAPSTEPSSAAQAFEPELKQSLANALVKKVEGVDRFDMEVWLTDYNLRLSRFMSDPAERLVLLTAVYEEAYLARLQPELVLAVIHLESLFDRFAISRVGARGLMQVMPFWLKELSQPDDNLFKIATNLRFGCTILRHYLDKERGNLTEALARYNGSYGSYLYPNKVYQLLRLYWYPS